MGSKQPLPQSLTLYTFIEAEPFIHFSWKDDPEEFFKWTIEQEKKLYGLRSSLKLIPS
jgi:hypothetical protein